MYKVGKGIEGGSSSSVLVTMFGKVDQIEVVNSLKLESQLSCADIEGRGYVWPGVCVPQHSLREYLFEYIFACHMVGEEKGVAKSCIEMVVAFFWFIIMHEGADVACLG